MNVVHQLSLPVICLAASLAACGGQGGRDGTEAGQETGSADTGAAVGPMGRMQGMGSDAMMDQMQAHVHMMAGVSADSMRAVIPTHRQLVANMISQVNREMRDMNMAGDAGWTATMDSVRQDLIQLPDLSAAELWSSFPAHRTRVMRLVDSHRAMMQNMRR